MDDEEQTRGDPISASRLGPDQITAAERAAADEFDK